MDIQQTYPTWMNPSLFIIGIVGLCLLCILYVFTSTATSAISVSTSTATSTSVSTWIMAAVLGSVCVVLFYWLFPVWQKMDITTTLKNALSGHPEIELRVDAAAAAASPSSLSRPQVFNIPDNHYSYYDAKALCKAYDARLATYEEIENAYRSGGEWRSYGWSDGQLGLFATQKTTFDHLQTVPGHEQDRGRIGVNGGFFQNPLLKLGANCYGRKPGMTQEEEELMNTQPLYPVTKQDLAMEARVNYWKNNLDAILVSPFNSTTWAKL